MEGGNGRGEICKSKGGRGSGGQVAHHVAMEAGQATPVRGRFVTWRGRRGAWDWRRLCNPPFVLWAPRVCAQLITGVECRGCGVSFHPAASHSALTVARHNYVE